MEIGTNWVLTEGLTIATVEAIVCKLYEKKCTSVDVLRYELHCAKEGKVASESCTIQLDFVVKYGRYSYIYFLLKRL